jgi:hypothetical protein
LLVLEEHAWQQEYKMLQSAWFRVLLNYHLQRNMLSKTDSMQ